MSKDVRGEQLKNNQYSVAVNVATSNEADGFVVNLEPSNYYSTKFPDDYVVVGYKTNLLNGRTYYFLTSLTEDSSDPNFKRSSFGYVDNNNIYNINYNNVEATDSNSDCNECGYKAFNPLVDKLEDLDQVPSLTYVELINDKCLDVYAGLNLDINFPIKKIEINQEKLGTTIYWNDYRNPRRYLNVTDLEEKGAQNYLFELDIPCEDISYGTCIDIDKLLIDPNYNRIVLEPSEQQVGGNLKKGTYEFWAAYCDLLGNEMTQYSTPTNPISIFDENNNVMTQTETDEFTNYAIKIKVKNLDVRHFKYYKIAVVERNNVANTQSVFLAGIYPTTDDLVVYTHSGSNNDDLYIARGNVSIKKRMDFNTLNAIKPRWEKAKSTMVSGDVLWHFGLVQEEELNIQPVMNLFGALLHWQTSAVSENLYKNAIATSKYKAYSRDEVQPFGIRLLYKDGGYSTTIPFVGRPAKTGEKDVLTADTNLESVTVNGSPCTTTDRTRKWQIYNTATAYEELCTDIEDSATEIIEDVTKSCVLEGVNNLSNGSVTIEYTPDYTNLENYVKDHPDDPNISVITDALNLVYPGNCVPTYIGDCQSPVLSDEYNIAGELTNEQETTVDKSQEDYLQSVPPAICAPYKTKVGTTVGYEVDEKFTEDYMGYFPNGAPRNVYFRTGTFNNETCGYAKTLVQQDTPSQPGEPIYLNYDGSLTESDLLQTAWDVEPSTISGNFKNKLHTKAQFFKVIKNGRSQIVFEITKKTPCPANADRDFLPEVSDLRYTIYNSCSLKTVLGGNIVDLNSGELLLIDVSSFPETFFIAVDAPIITETIDTNPSPIVTDPLITYKVVPPCGCFSMFARNTEPKEITITWDNIRIDKVQEYEASCTFKIPKVNDCEPIPYRKGIMAYWESTEAYDDNKQLWDSSEIVIRSSDLNSLSDTDKAEFLEYYTNGIDSNGYYNLKNADFRCQPIRHPKFPDNTVAPYIIDNINFQKEASSIIFPLGLELDSAVIRTVINIAYSNNLITAKQRDKIIGYEIMRGDNSISKSVIASGIAFDVYNYQKNNDTIHFSNFPYNDLGQNKYLLQKEKGNLIDHPFNSEKNHLYTFLSPDIFLTRNSIPTEASLQGFVLGTTSSEFTAVDKHSEWTVLGDKARKTSETLAIAEVALETIIKTGELLHDQSTVVGVSSGGTSIGGGLVFALIAVAGIAATNGINVGKYRYDWLRTFRDLGRTYNFASFQTGVANYNKLLKAEQYSNDYLRRLTIRKFLKDGDYTVVDENDGKQLKINNWLRETSAFISTGEQFPFDYSAYTEYISYDNNKKSPMSSSNFVASEVNCQENVSFQRNVGSPYLILKNYIPDQWGQVDSIKWLTTNTIVGINDNTACKPIFGGTFVISRFSWRRKTPIFRKNAIGLADKLPFMYSRYDNIGFPRFYCNYELDDGDNMYKGFLGVPYPDINSTTAFDCETGRTSMYYKPPSKFYTSVHGVVDFLVESEINCNFRYARKEPKDNFYPQNQNISEWLQETNLPLAEPNTFFYNSTYSFGVSNSPYKFFDKTYDKEIWRKRNIQKNAVTWSQKEVNENDLTNPWLVYKPLDWYEFKTNNGDLIDMHNIESNQFISRFENRLMLHNAIDTFAEKLTPQNRETGIAGMFYQRPIEFKSTDLGFMGTQHTDIVSTPYGHFWVDALRGKIFKLDQNGQGVEIISEQANGQPTYMKQWFREHLPMKILKQFPNIDIDNKYKGIGFNMWYDDRESRLFITKRDYKIINKECLGYDEEIGFYYNCGDSNISCPDGYTYNPLTEKCERQVTSSPLCPAGYTYDVGTQSCVLVTIDPADCSCTVDVATTPSSQNINSGDTTSIALTSTTPGATFTWTVLQSGVSGAVNGSGSTISQTLTATGGGAGTVLYTVTPAFEDCTPIPTEVIVTVQPSINFDVVSNDWGTLTTASAWQSFFAVQSGATFATVSDFSLVSGRVRLRVNTDLTSISLPSRNITTVNIVSIPTLTSLNLSSNAIVNFNPIVALPSGFLSLSLINNQIVTFNPTIPLPSSLLTLNLTNNDIVTFNPTIALPSSLQNLILQGNNIVTFDPSIALPSTLKQLVLSTNDIVTFNPSIALPNSLENLSLNVNDINVFNPTIALPSSLKKLFLNSNNISSFNPTLALPASLDTLELPNNDITVTAWNTDTAWIALAPNNGTLNANNNIPANGITGTNTESMLLAKGWTIIP